MMGLDNGVGFSNLYWRFYRFFAVGRRELFFGSNFNCHSCALLYYARNTSERYFNSRVSCCCCTFDHFRGLSTEFI